jgi:hypothetical protein
MLPAADTTLQITCQSQSFETQNPEPFSKMLVGGSDDDANTEATTAPSPATENWDSVPATTAVALNDVGENATAR